METHTERGVYPPKSMIHIVCFPYFIKDYKFFPIFVSFAKINVFGFSPILTMMYFVYHALHVLDTTAYRQNIKYPRHRQ